MAEGFHILPAGLDHAGDFALEGELPEAETAKVEFSQIASRAATEATAMIRPRLELRGASRLHDQRRLRHLYPRRGAPPPFRCSPRELARAKPPFEQDLLPEI